MAKTSEKNENVIETGKTKITLPRARKGEAEDLFVGVNGVSYLIPKGKEVEVPDFVAEEIRRSQAADDFMHDAAEELQNRQ